jgi:uncharacterized protein involved in outer membrane biogenesis
MKSKLSKILLILVILLALLYIGVNFFVGSLAKTAVNRYGPQLTQTKVVLGGAQISPLTGNGTLTDLFVGNPPGWSSEKAFSFSSIHVEVVPSSIFKDHIVIKELVIEKPEFVYETKFVASNISQLLKQIEGASSGASKANTATTKSGQPLKFAVGHLSLTGGTVTLGVGPTAITVPMPPIELNNVGGTEGITSDQLAVAVMRAVSADVLQTVVQSAAKLGGNLGGAAGDAAKNAASGLKGLFGK